MHAFASVAISGLVAMVCWLLQLCLSCASLAVSCCVMGTALRSAKARFSILVATLVLMMGYVWTGVLLAVLHPLVTFTLLLSLLACWGAGSLLLSLLPFLVRTACGFLEQPRRRRLSHDLRKQCKRAAKQERKRIFRESPRAII